MPRTLASASTSTPPLEPGDIGAVNCRSLYPLPAPGTSSAMRVALRIPEEAVQGKPAPYDTAKTGAPAGTLAAFPIGNTGKDVAGIRSAATSRRSSAAINSTWSYTSPFFRRICTSRIPLTTWLAVRMTPSCRRMTPEPIPAS